MVPCRTNHCQYCHSMENRNQTSSRSAIDFENSSQHRFVNGYTSYLNCPAVCILLEEIVDLFLFLLYNHEP